MRLLLTSESTACPLTILTVQCSYTHATFTCSEPSLTELPWNRAQRGSNGAWQKFERGEMSLYPFYEAFGRELSDTMSGNLWYKEYCARKGLGMFFVTPFPIRRAGITVPCHTECPRLPDKLNIDGREVNDRRHFGESYRY